MRMAGGDPQAAVAGSALDPSNKQTTLQKSGYQWRHTTRSGRRKGSPHSRPFPNSAFRRHVTSQSALRDYPSGSSFDTDLDSRMGMKRIQPSDDPRGGDCAPTGSFGILPERNGGKPTRPGEANAETNRAGTHRCFRPVDLPTRG